LSGIRVVRKIDYCVTSSQLFFAFADCFLNITFNFDWNQVLVSKEHIKLFTQRPARAGTLLRSKDIINEEDFDLFLVMPYKNQTNINSILGYINEKGMEFFK